MNDYNPNQIASNANNQTSTILTVTEITDNQTQTTLQTPSSNKIASTNNFNDNIAYHELD